MSWAGFIVGLTSVPGSDVPDVAVPHIDKLVHFALYAVLGLLVARALRGAAPDPRARPAIRTLMPWIGAIGLYAAVDEWHQRWIPGRSADLGDWCFDLAGGTLALLLGARPVARPDHLT